MFYLFSFCTRERLRLNREVWIRLDTLTTETNVLKMELETLSEEKVTEQFECLVKRYLDLHRKFDRY